MSEFGQHDWRERPYGEPRERGPRGRGRGGPGMGDPRSGARGRGGPNAGGPFGRRQRGGPGGGGMHRAARGDVRAAILALLAEQGSKGGPAINGYQMIQELSARTGGAWTPSPGSIYPTLQLLEDEGLVVSNAPEGRRVFELTEAGKAELEQNRQSRAPWERVADRYGESRFQLKIALREAVEQLMWAGAHASYEQRAEIEELLGELKEKLAAIFPEGLGDEAAKRGRPGPRATRMVG